MNPNAYPDPANPDRAESIAVAGSARAPRILAVDDEPRLLSSLCDLLAGRGYELATATCGHEALEWLQQRECDLILLDLRLPDMYGHEIMDIIHSRGIEAKVVVLSGDRGIEAAIGALKRGAFGYLRKPYAYAELIRTVENALRQRQLELENQRIALDLDESEKRYRYYIDNSPDIIYTLTGDGRISFINQRVEQLLGVSPGEVIGKHYSSLVHDGDLEHARHAFSRRRLGKRAARKLELRLKSLRRDGDERTFENTVKTLPVSLGADAQHEAAHVPGAFGVARDITDSKRAQELVSYRAYHDVLTDLPNRILLADRFGLASIQASRNGAELALMFVDLDRFKIVNDTLGHVAGDELLCQVATRVKRILRQGDTLARLGGDEFILFLPEPVNRQHAARVAEKVLQSLGEPFAINGHEVGISASVGIAMYPHDGQTLDQLLHHADIAMYQVKGQGKNGQRFYDAAMLDSSKLKSVFEQGIRTAIAQDQLRMYYQPQVDIASGDIVGIEGTVRWLHPERGLLSAGEFLPFAEENGLMVPISDWMLSAACRDLQQLNEASGRRVRLALNVSPQYLDSRDFFTRIQYTLDACGIAPSQIEVEVTENICIRNPQHAIEQLNRLCQLGVSVAIDDFGTGYSSLAYLHRFPIHTIKIDQSFVKDIRTDSGHYPIVTAIIAIARGLGLQLIAEGVESAMQARFLEQAGCTTVQGHWFHAPQTRDELLALLLRVDEAHA